jgi:hypothetical protein
LARKSFGIQAHTFSGKVFKIYMVPGCVMVLLWKKASFMTRMLEITEFPKLISKESKNKSKDMRLKSSHIKEFYLVKPKLYNCSHIIPSKWNLLRAKSHKTDSLQRIDAETLLICVLDLTFPRLISSRPSRLPKTHQLTGWERSRMTICKECTLSHIPNNCSSISR